MIRNMSTSKETTDIPDRGYIIFIYPWKLWTKQSFSYGNSANCFTSIGNSKSKIQDYCNLFKLSSESSTCYSFDTPRNFRNKPLVLVSLYYYDRYILMHLQILFLNALNISIY